MVQVVGWRWSPMYHCHHVTTVTTVSPLSPHALSPLLPLHCSPLFTTGTTVITVTVLMARCACMCALIEKRILCLLKRDEFPTPTTPCSDWISKSLFGMLRFICWELSHFHTNAVMMPVVVLVVVLVVVTVCATCVVAGAIHGNSQNRRHGTLRMTLHRLKRCSHQKWPPPTPKTKIIFHDPPTTPVNHKKRRVGWGRYARRKVSP
jgi:hypothetical protein